MSRRVWGRLACVAMAVWLTAGCVRTDEINTTYGKRRGVMATDSVNGTAVLAGMFERAGWRVFSWYRLSPRLKRCDVIVWAPDDFRPPTLKARRFLEEWLYEQEGRTLVYIGRDFDAEIDYWRMMRQHAEDEELPEIMRRLAQAQTRYERRRGEMPDELYAGWFTMRQDPPTQLSRLQGPWSEGLDARQAQVVIAGRLDPPDLENDPVPEADADAVRSRHVQDLLFVRSDEDDEGEERYADAWDVTYPVEVERLLYEGERTMVSRVIADRFDGSQVLVITNGSFLLNLPLVNHEHRRLAGRLIAACGEPGTVAFVESGPGAIAVMDQEPGAAQPSYFGFLIHWPTAPIVMHLLILGMIICFMLAPIFGRPRQHPGDSVSDFGKHIHALGRLMARTGDEQYARMRLRYYHEHVRDAAEDGRAARVGGREAQTAIR